MLASAAVFGTSVVVSGLSVSGIAQAATTHAASYPVTIMASNGKVTLANEPKHIISLSPTATDMLFAIGAGKQVVAVDADSTYPSNAPKTSLSGLTPNVEAIAKYHPDLVVVSYDSSNIVASLTKLSVPVLVEPATSTLAASYAQIAALGTATGHRAGAATVVKNMRTKIVTAAKAVPAASKGHSYYYELDQTYYSVTSSTFIGQVLAMFGLHNIADKAKGASSGYPQLSQEYIVKSNPQLIFLADTICCHQSVKTVTARKGWASIGAVKSGAIVPLNDSVASQWGPHIVTLVTDVKQALVRLYGQSAAAA
jgi:iron complex transport system substrate-binding protein